MCTVSIYKHKHRTIITSNRDEYITRASALQPILYESGNYKLVYCKDMKAGGTWLVLRNDGTVIVLLNGAFNKHQAQLLYRKSRGIVVLEIINHEDCLSKFQQYDLTNIEPFTIILCSHTGIFKCIWDGHEKYSNEINPEEAHIFSSVTLYEEEARNEKCSQFKKLVNSKNVLDKDDILQFHHSNKDPINGFLINRNNQLLTLSVTQVVLDNMQNTFYHHDILQNKDYTLTICNHQENFSTT